ncbi:MAG TPA: hypothetical protein VIN07_07860 [Flavipsychrobacter sp.]
MDILKGIVSEHSRYARLEELKLNMEGATRAALIMHNGKPLMVVESVTKKDEDILQKAMDFIQLPGAAIKYVWKIPLDKRHRTKVDYEQLKKVL